MFTVLAECVCYVGCILSLPLSYFGGETRKRERDMANAALTKREPGRHVTRKAREKKSHEFECWILKWMIFRGVSCPSRNWIKKKRERERESKMFEEGEGSGPSGFKANSRHTHRERKTSLCSVCYHKSPSEGKSSNKYLHHPSSKNVWIFRVRGGKFIERKKRKHKRQRRCPGQTKWKKWICSSNKSFP